MFRPSVHRFGADVKGWLFPKNQGLGFTIPYTLNGEEKQYYPDFIAQIDTGDARSGSVRLQPDLRHGGFGRWAFVEVTDPWDAQRLIRGAAAQSGSVMAL